MPKKRIGTLSPFPIHKFIIAFLILFFIPNTASAVLFELSEFQSADVFLDETREMALKVSKNGLQLDAEETDFFFKVPIKPTTFSDDNQAFTLTDHYILNSDLEIEKDYTAILCSAFPPKMQLSINDISISDYTVEKSEPTYYITSINGKDPFTGEDIIAMQMEVKDAEVFAEQMLQKSTINDSYIGYGENIYGKIIRARIAVWTRSTLPPVIKRCKSSDQNSASNIRPIRLIVLSSDNPCIGKPYLLEPPKRSGSFQEAAERKTPAAINWSYNSQMASKTADNAVQPAAAQSTRQSTCPTCQ